MAKETPHAQISRIFGMGAYGEQLAATILREYGEQIARYLECNDFLLAAEEVREFNGLDFE